MHSYPCLDESSLAKIEIGEEENDILAIVHYESRLGEAFFQVHPDHTYLKPVMLKYAENNIFGKTENKEKYLRIYINDFDIELATLTESRGYVIAGHYTQSVAEFKFPSLFPAIKLPEGEPPEETLYPSGECGSKQRTRLHMWSLW